jgi:type 1 fimbriae regulatory protein FimB
MRTTNRRSVKGGGCRCHERDRDYLGPDEIERLLEAAKKAVTAPRPRVAAVHLPSRTTRQRVDEYAPAGPEAQDVPPLGRAAQGVAVHRASGRGRRASRLKRYLAARQDSLPWLFVSEQGTQLTRQAVNYLIRQAGERAGLGKLHPHMLRHSCGFALANAGKDMRTIQDYLGHRDPRHTAHYTRTASHRFEGLWR